MRRAAWVAVVVTGLVAAALVVTAVAEGGWGSASGHLLAPVAGGSADAPVDYSTLPRDPLVPVTGLASDTKLGAAPNVPAPAPPTSVSVPWQFAGLTGTQLIIRVAIDCAPFAGVHVVETDSDVVVTAVNLPVAPSSTCPPPRAAQSSVTLAAPLGNRALRHAGVTASGYTSILTANDPAARTPTFTPVIRAQQARGLLSIGWNPVSVSPDGRQFTVQVLPSETGLCLERVVFELSETPASVQVSAYGRAWTGDCLESPVTATLALDAPLALRAVLHANIDEPGFREHDGPPISAPTAQNHTGISAGWSAVSEDPLRITVAIYYPACYVLDGFEVAQDRDAVQLRMLIRIRPPTAEPQSCGLPATLIEEIYLDKPLGERPLLHAYVPPS